VMVLAQWPQVMSGTLNRYMHISLSGLPKRARPDDAASHRGKVKP
jgi:hypothetical protein